VAELIFVNSRINS